MLSRHPDTYSEAELDAWVRHLVHDRVAEGSRLDYKESLSLETPRERREGAKDISSFANEVGGVVLYGIPEERVGEATAIPRSPYGIDTIHDIESRLENVWIDAIRPRLPEWRIRRIALTEYPGKVVYFGWTPESWMKPHMVEAYGDRRYYRRGQLRAVEMAEHEVQAAYRDRAVLQERIDHFLQSQELTYLVRFFSEAPQDPEMLFRSHYVLCPLVLIPDRVDFNSAEMRQWLRKNPYPPSGWQPSPYGVRTTLDVKSNGDWQPITEIYSNGAISHWRPSSISRQQQGWGFACVVEFREILEFLRFGQRFYTTTNYVGPLHLQITLSIPTGQTLHLPPSPRNTNRWEWMPLLAHDDFLQTHIVVSAIDLEADPDKVLRTIADQVFRAFGLWEADCFNAQGKLI